MSAQESDSLCRDWLYEACRIEVLAPKPGNVHPGQEFADASVTDFLTSARVSAPILSDAGQRGVGRCIYDAVRATHEAVGHNTNLGILLLLAPLAAVPRQQKLSDGIDAVLQSLTVEDAEWTYQAIRLASPGGLGAAEDQDVNDTPTLTLQECMQQAAERDLIAAQYSSGFPQVLQQGLAWWQQADDLKQGQRVVWLALQLMAQFGDTLIARKCGEGVSARVREQAQEVLAAGGPRTPAGRQLCQQFDIWLRSDGHRRNPGTTADMVAATLYAALRDLHYKPEDL